MACPGEPVEFEFSSADASTAAVLVVRNAGSRASRTLGAEERLIIQSVTAQIVTASANIIADTDGDGDIDAGDLMVPLGVGNTSVVLEGMGGGICGTKGIMPKVKASGAGQIYLAGIGVIVKG